MDKVAYRCNGTIKLKGQEVRCNKIIAEIERVNDAKLFIKCQKCGTMNTIEATPKQKNELQLGSFSIQHFST